MSTTTAADLLERADLLTRGLRTQDRPVTPERWATFDRTAHRALTELLGPHGTWIPDSRTSGPLQTVVDHYPTPDQHRPDRDEHAPGASPTDPHPLARLTRTLAAFADLMHQPDDVRADVLRSTAELANVTARVLTITAVAARYTMTHMPLREAMPPLTTGTFAEDMLAALPTVPGQRLDRGLRMVAAVTPAQPMLDTDRLDLAIDRWDTATADALDAAVPCADVLRTLATQGTHLYGVTARLYAHHDPAAAVPPAFPTAIQRLTRVGETWIPGMTSLTPPSHPFVAASRDLYEQLARLDHRLTQHPDTVESDAVAAKLARAAHRFNRHLDAAEQLPEQLLHSGLLFAPARQLAPHPERIKDHVRGRLVTVRPLDAKHLISAWHAGITAARGATTTISQPTTPSRARDRESTTREPATLEIYR